MVASEFEQKRYFSRFYFKLIHANAIMFHVNGYKINFEKQRFYRNFRGHRGCGALWYLELSGNIGVRER